jgi:signal transduction histidine kinase
VNTAAPQIARFPQVVATRVSGLPARQQELLQDTALAIALAVINVLTLLPYRTQEHPFWLAMVLVALEALPLAVRRRWNPVLVIIVVGAARITFDQIGLVQAPFPLGVAIALYTCIDRASRPWRWIVIVVTVPAALIGLAAPGHNEPYDAITQAFILVTAGVAGYLTRVKRIVLESARSRAERAEAELDREASRAAATERTRIARELHDVVAHHVSLMAVQAEAAASLLPGQPEKARTSVDIIGDTARVALTELRRLLGVLRSRSEQLETSPSASLDDLASVLDQVRGAGLAVEYEVAGIPGRLAPGVDLTAFRIIQEALTNSIRHARAAQARVTVTHEPGYVTVSVADTGPRRGLLSPAGYGPGPDGKAGPDTRLTAAGLAGSGLGLAGIAERVASCGGQLTVGPTPAGGFAVTARLPAS